MRFSKLCFSAILVALMASSTAASVNHLRQKKDQNSLSLPDEFFVWDDANLEGVEQQVLAKCLKEGGDKEDCARTIRICILYLG